VLATTEKPGVPPRFGNDSSVDGGIGKPVEAPDVVAMSTKTELPAVRLQK